WLGIFPPGSPPPPGLARLNGDLKKAPAADDLKASPAQGGGGPRGTSAEEGATFLRAQFHKWEQGITDGESKENGPRDLECGSMGLRRAAETRWITLPCRGRVGAPLGAPGWGADMAKRTIDSFKRDTARRLRLNQTGAEERLWRKLRHWPIEGTHF